MYQAHRSYYPQIYGGIGPSVRSQAAARRNPWIKFCRQYRASHPDATADDCRRAYKKKGRKSVRSPKKAKKTTRRKGVSKKKKGKGRKKRVVRRKSKPHSMEGFVATTRAEKYYAEWDFNKLRREVRKRGIPRPDHPTKRQLVIILGRWYGHIPSEWPDLGPRVDRPVTSAPRPLTHINGVPMNPITGLTAEEEGRIAPQRNPTRPKAQALTHINGVPVNPDTGLTTEEERTIARQAPRDKPWNRDDFVQFMQNLGPEGFLGTPMVQQNKSVLWGHEADRQMKLEDEDSIVPHWMDEDWGSMAGYEYEDLDGNIVPTLSGYQEL